MRFFREVLLWIFKMGLAMGGFLILVSLFLAGSKRQAIFYMTGIATLTLALAAYVIHDLIR